MIEEKWHDCNWVGDIRIKDDSQKKSDKPVENIEDYDVRKKLGCKVFIKRSVFDRMEA